MGIKYKDPTTGNFKEINVKVADTLPVGSEVDYNGTTIPTGWEEVDSPNDYSTEETKIGTWIDGKPLYRKTLNITSGFSTRLNITHNISNIDYCKCYGTLITGGTMTEHFYASSTDYFRCFRDGDIVKIRYGTDNNPTTIIINLEYTKTTD